MSVPSQALDRASDDSILQAKTEQDFGFGAAETRSGIMGDIPSVRTLNLPGGSSPTSFSQKI